MFDCSSLLGRYNNENNIRECLSSLVSPGLVSPGGPYPGLTLMCVFPLLHIDIYIYIYIHSHMYTHTYTYLHNVLRIHTHRHSLSLFHTHTHTHTQHTHTHTQTHMYIHTCRHACTYNTTNFISFHLSIFPQHTDKQKTNLLKTIIV